MKKWLASFLAVLSLSAPAEFTFNKEKAFAVPETFPADALKFGFPIPEGIRPILFAGEEYIGAPTKVFAWYGVPKNVQPPYPAVVLVHGGGGTAFTEWVRRWNERGFAAIAVDTQGSVPTAPWEGMTRSVPLEGGASGVPMMRTGLEPAELWPYFAVTSVIRANSLLRSFPEIDTKRIGLTGISWGGVITEIVSSIDDRFQYAIPVYGCGFLDDEPSYIKAEYASEGPQAWKQWYENFDPSFHLPKTTIPIFFINDCDDVCFYMTQWLKTTRLPKGQVFRYAGKEFTHSHNQGDHTEVLRFARAMAGTGTMPPTGKVSRKGRIISATFEGGQAPYRAELLYTTETFTGKKRNWQTTAARVMGNRLSAIVPNGAVEMFFNLYDAEGPISLFPEETAK